MLGIGSCSLCGFPLLINSSFSGVPFFKELNQTKNAEFLKNSAFLAIPAGFEPATSGLGNLRSIQLNYGTNCCAQREYALKDKDTAFGKISESEDSITGMRAEGGGMNEWLLVEFVDAFFEFGFGDDALSCGAGCDLFVAVFCGEGAGNGAVFYSGYCGGDSDDVSHYCRAGVLNPYC